MVVAGCLGWCSTLATSASAAVIFSNVDPLNTNLALLSDQTLAGGHESNTVEKYLCLGADRIRGEQQHAANSRGTI